MQQAPAKVPMNQIPLMPTNAQASSGVPLKTLVGPTGQTLESTPVASPKKSPKTMEIQPLTDIFMSLENIKPGMMHVTLVVSLKSTNEVT